MKMQYIAIALLVLVVSLGCIQQDDVASEGDLPNGGQGVIEESDTFNSEDDAFSALEKELENIEDTGIEELENLLTG